LLTIFAIHECDNEQVNAIARRLHHDFSSRTEAYFKNISCITATYLDPRYKKFKFIADTNERDAMIFKAKQYIKNLARSLPLAEKNRASDTETPPAKKAKTNENFSLLIEDSDNDDENIVENDVASEIISELNHYDRQKVANLQETSSPLDYFKEMQLVLPHLTRIAKMVHAIPATSVPSECLFSHAGEVTTERRNRLSPTNVESLMIIRENRHLFKD
jgi:hypothetical protein